MNNIILKRLGIVILVTIVCNTTYGQNDFSIITSRIREQAYEDTNEQTLLKNIAAYLPLIQNDGSWTDIDYSTKDITLWKPATHLIRIKNFAQAFVKEGGSYYKNADLWNKILSTLRFWYAQDPRSKNWWHNEIATPQMLGEIMIVLQQSKQQLPVGLQDSLLQRMKQGNVFKQTGANKFDIALHMMYRACITKDKALMDTAVEQAFQPIVFTNAEGLQYDNSYMQHGAQLQISSYGLVFLAGEYKVASWLQGTAYALQDEKLKLLNNYLLQTFLPSIRGSYSDFNIEGRGISRPNILDKRKLAEDKNANTFLEIAKKVCNENRSLIDDAIARVSGTEAAKFNVAATHNYFWKGDYTQHLRPAYTFNVRMVSVRTKRTEAGNNENLLGKFLPDGATDIQRSGGEYFNIMPIWEWDKIPGITSRDFKTDQPTVAQWGEQGSTSFVGGVSDGIFGAAAYDMNYDSVTAKKAWFFFDKEVVCLGAGINSKAPENITTTINQCRLNGKVLTNENGNITTVEKEITSNLLRWVWHDSIGYFFPGKENINVSSQSQSGNWNKINTSYSKEEITGNVFKMWVNHGQQATNSSYAYIAVPGISQDEMKSYPQNKLIILSNTDSIQAVEHSGLKMIQVVFYKPGTIAAKDIVVSADKPCIILLKKETDSISVFVADPTQQNKEVVISLKSIIKNSERKLTCLLPKGNFAGATAHFKVQL